MAHHATAMALRSLFSAWRKAMLAGPSSTLDVTSSPWLAEINR
jgi:hypothetical protein